VPSGDWLGLPDSISHSLARFPHQSFRQFCTGSKRSDEFSSTSGQPTTDGSGTWGVDLDRRPGEPTGRLFFDIGQSF